MIDNIHGRRRRCLVSRQSSTHQQAIQVSIGITVALFLLAYDEHDQTNGDEGNRRDREKVDAIPIEEPPLISLFKQLLLIEM